ncbi:MAG: M14 family metallopeptidase [Vicinamibacteria bacterium]|nr:M14 family metallopeptidase [Vicinamibacteria bacterium]
MRLAAAAALCFALLAPAVGADDPWAAPLPPVPAWSGASRDRVAPAGHPWITPAEVAGFRTTPSYDETVAWLQRLDAASDRVAMVPIGRSGEGRTLWMVVASALGAATPEAVRAAGKPVLLAQAGIHAGEIDGKDAGLMLLRDMAFADAPRAALLERATLLFVPILNADGHERVSPRSRINQRGPENAGWRTNARNLNLNRDYTKLDTPEIRAVVAALQAWGADLYFDLHVTDGGDHAYDITFGATGPHGHSPAIDGWMSGVLGAALSRDLAAAGHEPGPLYVANWVDSRDPSKGFRDFPASARLSHPWGDARHLGALLVENHSLKPYDRRVLGTHVLLESALRALGERGAELKAATAADRARRPAEVPVAWKPSGAAVEVDAKLIAWRHEPSAATGRTKLVYTGEVVTRKLPLYTADAVATSVQRPRAYWLGPQWDDAIERLRLQGVAFETLTAPREAAVELCRLVEAEVTPVNEGRAGLGKANCRWERATRRFPKGSVRVPTDQDLGALAIVLLDPLSPESFLRWGFFNSVLARTEYVEEYVMAPLGERMLEGDPKLRADFEAALAADPKLAADGDARLRWLYARTPWADAEWRVAPVAVER